MIENNKNKQLIQYDSDVILVWSKKYTKDGFEVLDSKTSLDATGGKKKPKEKKYEDMTKEELIKEIKIINYVNEIYKKEIDKNK